MGYATEEIQSKSLAEEIQFKSPVEEIQIGKKSTLNLLLDSDGINFVFWCCTDHKPPDGPHCSIDKEELKKVTKCNHFKIAN